MEDTTELGLKNFADQRRAYLLKQIPAQALTSTSPVLFLESRIVSQGLACSAASQNFTLSLNK